MNQRELTRLLIEACRAYYGPGAEIMDDRTFDHYRETLAAMEEASGVVLPGSPTVTVGTAPLKELPKVRHEVPALSLDKFKYEEREKMQEWLRQQSAGVLSWKMDGMTIVASYDDGLLKLAATRGGGEVGNDITARATLFQGLPLQIPYRGHLVVRGEGVMTYAEFQRINDSLDEGEETYKNPRNLASSVIQQIDPAKYRDRVIQFYAFELVSPEPQDNNHPMMAERLNWLESMGFQVVEHTIVTADTFLDTIEEWKERVEEGKLPFPTDGLVVSYDDLVEGWDLGTTGSHPRWAMALKWNDDVFETEYIGTEWSASKTGLINPVAVFRPVEIEGTTVSRASVHNVSIMQAFRFGKGDRITVYKANMIIPQVAENLTKSGTETVPDICPICGKPTRIKTRGEVKTLWCENPACPAKARGLLETAFCKDGLNVKGMGPVQIRDMQEVGLLGAYPRDLFRLYFENESGENTPEFREKKRRLLAVPGWGQKSWDNLMAAVGKARDTDLRHFIYALGIPLIGHDMSKRLDRMFTGRVKNFLDFVQRPDMWFVMNDDGVGEVKAQSFVNWCVDTTSSPEKWDALLSLIGMLKFNEPEVRADAGSLSGYTFVITGAVHDYKNRDEFKTSVESRGGKVAGSVSKKTDYLVNNDVTSTSGKNKKAKELGVPIISEDEFISRFGK